MLKPSTKRKTFDTDSCMRRLYESIVRDFRAEMGPEYKERELMALRGGMLTFRSMTVPDRLQAPPRLFKMEAQLENLFKRYRFRQDVYTDESLSELTFQKFAENQERLAKHQQMPLRLSTSLVLRQARKIIREILEKVDLPSFTNNCRFSTRATQGNPARDAYIDHKLADPISGSPEHIRWFSSHLTENYALFRALVQCSPSGEPCYEVCNSLKLVEVPKSWKSFRLIMPNTLIGSYYTYGLGLLLAEALKEEGLDIAKLQNQHKLYAQLASIHRAWVTADMSNASESFLFWLMSRLLPQKWLRALNCGRTRYYVRNGKSYAYSSFMAMGIGFTFPLQTLLFYAIIKSCCALLKIDGLISVYGDDLIYPRKIHCYVKSVLTDIGMLLNKDKTYVESHFRESCGGDYYHGVDVRPFQPEGQAQYLTAKEYEAWLYQLCNGLFARWDPAELPITARFLRLEILRVSLLVKQVPNSFPDYSGWRVDTPDTSPFSGMTPILVRFRNGTREFVIPHLRRTAKRRYVSFEDAYLYDWLRVASNKESEEEEPTRYHLLTLNEWLRVERKWRRRKIDQKWIADSRDALSLSPLPRQPRNYRGISGNRLKRCLATTPCKLEPQKITNCTETISDWI